jgi:hypothetical protein
MTVTALCSNCSYTVQHYDCPTLLLLMSVLNAHSRGRQRLYSRGRVGESLTVLNWFPPPWLKVFLLSIYYLDCSVRFHFFRGIIVSFHSVPSFGIGSSAELGMPRNEHFLPRNNGNYSESIPRNFFGTKFRSQPYLHNVMHVITPATCSDITSGSPL